MKWTIITKVVIVASLLWEMAMFGGAFRGSLGSSYRFDVGQFFLMSMPVVAIIGLMWIFGVFRLKEIDK